MTRFWRFILLALLVTCPGLAYDLADTNQMPHPIHTLMESAGYVVVQTNVPPAAPNVLKQLPPIEPSKLRPLELPKPKKSGWSFWKNSTIKYAGKGPEPLNVFAPTSYSLYTALSQFEYDVTYSFDF